MITYDDITSPLKSGDPLPTYPAKTTARKITSYGFVFDAENNQRLIAGLHRNEISTLITGQTILDHAYRYAIVDRKIFHTRPAVVIHVATEPVDEPV